MNRLINKPLERLFLFYARRVFSEKIFLHYLSEVCEKEALSKRGAVVKNERPVEYRFVFECMASLNPMTILDVGTGLSALPSLLRTCGSDVSAIDNVSDYWPNGMVNRHFYIIDDDITRTSLSLQFDVITCISVLEHISDYDSAVTNMVSLLKPGGHLILSFPYSDAEYIENVYDLPDSAYGQDFPFITQSFSRRELNSWTQSFHLSVEKQEFWRFWTGPYWTVGSQLLPPERVEAWELHQLTCILLRKE